MESWDDENFEPPTINVAILAANKWEGEDEEYEVKDNWEDEEEEKQEEVKVEIKKSKKKTLEEKIAEKERTKEEQDRRLKELEEEEISPEERLKRQKESDLKIALETTFGESDTALGDLPTSKDEFQEFGDNLSKKLIALSKNSEYPMFAENLIRNLCASMHSQDIKKIKNTLDNLFLEKQKIEKGDKSKKNKGKGKVKLKMDSDTNQLSAYVNDLDDFNDFM